jgi:ubiquinone biosynthesis protein COQ9
MPFAEMTIDELREALAPRIAANAVFDGWGDKALADAAAAVGIPAERARLAYPGGGIDMIDAWFETIDEEIEHRHSRERLALLKVRDRIATLVLARIEIMRPQREAVRRALAKLALPVNLVRATRLGWRSADAMWSLAGDTATDFNHYTKRVTLSAVYGTTLLVWLDDDSEDQADTKAFLDRRIDGVMRFEKAKARLKPDPDRHFSPARFLGRLRYPDR